MEIKDIEECISKVPDYPKPGILFYDISSLLLNNKAFLSSIELLKSLIKKYKFDLIAGIDARGFIFASIMAYSFNKGLVMIRKKNKLPGNKISFEYELEYGKDTLEVNVNLKNKKIIIVDDLLATGGTLNAAIQLIEKSGERGELFRFFDRIRFPSWKKKKIKTPIETLIHY